MNPPFVGVKAMRLPSLTMVLFVVAAVTAVTVHAQTSAPSIRGTWAATATPNQTFQGTWTAQPGTDPDVSQGSWTLLDRSNRVAAEGTWSAVKTPRSWSGTWQARIAGTRRLLGGSWRTELPGSDVRTFIDLLQHTLQEQVSGTWAAAGRRGAWSLRAYK